MRIERSSLDQVRRRFEVNKKKMEEQKKEYVFEERIKELKEEVRNQLCHSWSYFASFEQETCQFVSVLSGC